MLFFQLISTIRIVPHFIQISHLWTGPEERILIQLIQETEINKAKFIKNFLCLRLLKFNYNNAILTDSKNETFIYHELSLSHANRIFLKLVEQ